MTHIECPCTDCAELRRDKARLDWLQSPTNYLGSVQLPTPCVLDHLDDMRGAIDAAMALDLESENTHDTN